MMLAVTRTLAQGSEDCGWEDCERQAKASVSKPDGEPGAWLVSKPYDEVRRRLLGRCVGEELLTLSEEWKDMWETGDG